MKNGLKLVLSILIPLAVGACAGIATASGVSGWYPTIQKPSWNPPNAVFAPVWMVLYVLMGVAFYLVWKSKPEPALRRPAIIFWSVQLVLNGLWSFLFFKQHDIGGALADINVLWLTILMTIIIFSRINKTAAWLLVPYISWVSFAALLNYAIWQLNT